MVRSARDFRNVNGPGKRGVRLAAIFFIVPKYAFGLFVLRQAADFAVLCDIVSAGGAEFFGRVRIGEHAARGQRFSDSDGSGLYEFADDHDRARRDGGAAVGHFMRVGLGDADVFVAKTERFGDNLAQHRVCSLAEFGAGDENAQAAVRDSFDADNRAEKALAGARKSCTVKKSGNAHSFFVAALLIVPRESLFLCVIVREFEGAVEKFAEIDLFVYGLAGCGGLPGFEEIAAPDFHWRKSDDLGDAVHVTLEREEGLRGAKSAERAMRRHTGGDCFSANANAGPIVGATGMDGAARKDDRRQRFVSAAVNGEVNFSSENSAVSADRGAVARSGRMALGGGRHVFHAVIDNFHGFAGLHGEERGVSGDHGGIFFLAAKSAAGFHLNDTHAICREVAELHQGFVNVIGALERAPNGEALLEIEGGDHSVVFYVELFLCASCVFGFDDVVCVLPHGIDIAFFDQIGFEDVVCAPDDLLRSLTFFHAEDGGKRIVFDSYGFDGSREKMAVGMCE